MKKNYINEFLFITYIFLFTAIKFVIKNFSINSFNTLLFFSIFLLVISFIYNGKKFFYIPKQLIFILLFTLILFSLSILFNENKYIYEYLYEFFIYGFISMLFYSKVNNKKIVIKIGSIYSVIFFIMYYNDALKNYYYFADYMSFGLYCMLPIFFFSILARKVLKKKFFIILEILALIELLLFCNRGAFFTAIIIEILFFIFDEEKNKYYIFKIITLLLLSVILIKNINNILLLIQNIMIKFNFSSYSIRAISLMISGNSNGLSGRDTIWSNAISYFYSNPLFGHGIGSFENIYNIYTHNLFLEILVSFGLLGLMLFFIILLKYIYCIRNKDNKFFYIGILILSIIPLMFSIYFYKWIYFWIFLYIAFDNKKVLN